MSPSEQQLNSLREACKKHAPVFLSTEGVDISFQTEILRVEPDHVVIENCVPPNYIRKVMGAKKYFLQLNMVRYQTDVIDTDGKHMIFPYKDLHFLEETRSRERISFTPDENVFTEIRNPYDGETVLRKGILDLSSSGMAIKTKLESMLFSPGLEIPQIDIKVDGSLFARTNGTVVYMRTVMDINGLVYRQVGIKFAGNIVSPEIINRDA